MLVRPTAAARAPPGERGRASGVVGGEPGPHEVPERGDGGRRRAGVSSASRSVAPARSASWRKNSAPPTPASASSSARCRGLSARSGLGVGEQQVGEVGRGEREPAVAAGQRSAPGPGDLAGRGQLVEQRGGVAGQPRGQHQGLQRARRDRCPRQLLDHGEDVVGAGRPTNPAAVLCSRRPPIPCHAGRNRPIAAGSTGSTSARSRASDPAGAGAGPRRRRSRGAASGSGPLRAARPGAARRGPAVPRRPSARARRATTATPRPKRYGGHRRPGRARGCARSGKQVAQRIGDGLGERLGHADRQRPRQGVAEAAGVIDRRSTARRRRPGHGSRGAPTRARGATRGRTPRAAASSVLRSPTKRSRSAVPSMSRDVALGVGALELALDLDQDLAGRAARGWPPDPSSSASRVESRAERGRAPLGQGRVELVEEHPDVAEHQRARERRRRRAWPRRRPGPTATRTSAHQLGRGRGRRRRPAGTRGRSRARPGTARTSRRR